jgi:hypothetical protein
VYGVKVIFLIIHILYKSSWLLSTLNTQKKIPRASRKSKVLYIVFIVLIMYDYI